jgi:hypothetical protein
VTDDPRAADDADDEAAPGDDGEGLSDPLDELGADEEPVDDPFAQLDADAADAPGDDAFDDEAFTDSGSDAPTSESEGPLFDEAKAGGGDAGDPTTDPDTHETDGAAASSVGGEAGERDDPFDELGPSTGDADLDEAFERMDVGELSDEDVWKSLDEDDGLAAPGAAGFDSAGPFGGADVDRVISKQAYCQQCPHFSAPPEATCTHDGTTILEAIGFDEFRVRNCPMVDDDPTFDGADAE